MVAQLSGMPSWDAFLQARLLGPLGMTHTTTQVRARHDPALRTSGHLHLPEDTVISPDGPFLESAGGAGNIRSSVTDLAQWLRLHLGQGKVDDVRILHANSLAPTYIPRIALEDPMATDARLAQDDTMSYATGWITHATPQGRLIEHSGGTIGYNSHIGFDPDRKFGFVVLVNQSYQGGTGLAVPLGKTIVDLLQGRSDNQYPKAVFEQIQTDMLMQRQAREIPENARPARPDQAYVGRYDNPAMGPISIQANGDGGLGFTLGPYKTRVQLSPYSGDIFLADVLIPTYDGSRGHLDQLRVRFFADDNDEIVGMRWLGEGDHAGQPAFERCG